MNDQPIIVEDEAHRKAPSKDQSSLQSQQFFQLFDQIEEIDTLSL